MRPLTKDEGISVKFIASLDPDKILVAFSDNSIDVLELPSMTLVGDLDAHWMGPANKSGNITVVYVDEPGEKNYTYIGTSEGVLMVVDVLDSAVRVCDFSLTWRALGLSKAMAVSDVQMYPKDEKFLTIGFQSDSALVGAVVIYDFSRMKVHRVFETKAISSMAWTSDGEALYAGSIY